MDGRDRRYGNGAMSRALADHLGVLEQALREAVVRDRIGAIRSMDILLGCREATLEPMVEAVLRQVDVLFGVGRHQLHRIGGDPHLLLLGAWAQGQLATISAGRIEGREYLDLIVLGSKGSMTHRWTGDHDAAL